IDWTNQTVILGSRNTTMEALAAYIPTLMELNRPVVDETGLAGKYDYELNFTPPWKAPKPEDGEALLDLTGPTLLDALKDQLGLKLKSTHAPVPTLVIDH